MSKVLNVAGHPVDIDDGRTLDPLAEAEADTDHPHNRALVIAGLLVVTEGTTPQKSQPERLVELAPESAVERVLAREAEAQAEASAPVQTERKDKTR